MCGRRTVTTTYHLYYPFFYRGCYQVVLVTKYSPTTTGHGHPVSRQNTLRVTLRNVLSVGPRSVGVSLCGVRANYHYLFSHGLSNSHVFGPSAPYGSVNFFWGTVRRVRFGLYIFVYGSCFRYLYFIFVYPSDQGSLWLVLTTSSLVTLGGRVHAFRPFFVFSVRHSVTMVSNTGKQVLL